MDERRIFRNSPKPEGYIITAQGQHFYFRMLFPLKWRIQNPDYLERLKIPKLVADETHNQQLNAIVDWPGVCFKLSNIHHPTLVILGTDCVFAVPVNSALIAKRIQGAKLVQIEGGGHGLMFQYPETISKTVNDFLSP